MAGFIIVGSAERDSDREFPSVCSSHTDNFVETAKTITKRDNVISHRKKPTLPRRPFTKVSSRLGARRRLSIGQDAANATQSGVSPCITLQRCYCGGVMHTNYSSFTKPEILNILQRRQMRTEQQTTCRENSVRFGRICGAALCRLGSKDVLSGLL